MSMAVSLYPSESSPASDLESGEGNFSSARAETSGSDDLFNHAIEMINALTQSEDVTLCSPSSSKKRKRDQNDIKDEIQKPAKRKIYRPKIISQIPKRTKKSQSDTPKPSTPYKRSYVRKTTKCQQPLFDDEHSVSLPFLKNFNNSMVEQDGFENSTIINESAVEHNSLQSYQKMASLGLCLVESKRFGGNFPIMCKRKRIRRQRILLVKLLPPVAKGKRSKSFIRKKKCCIDFRFDGRVSRRMRFIIKKIISLKNKKHGKTKKPDIPKKSGELVVYKRPSSGVDVILDEETLRVWNLLLAERGHEENDEQKRMHWEKIREAYHQVIGSFLDRMFTIQGDRRFLPWKGSILDSVVGVFLTQNVSDHLSSSAFMSLAAKFPVKSVSCEQSNTMVFSDTNINNEMNATKVEELESEKSIESSIIDNQGTENNLCYVEINSNSSKASCVQSNMVFSDSTSDKEMKDEIVEEMEAQKASESSKVDHSSSTERNSNSPNTMSEKKQAHTANKNKIQEEKEALMEKKRQHWDTLRKTYTKSHRHSDHVDSVDWETVRSAKATDVAKAIENRGQHNIIAGRIRQMLNTLMDTNGSMDLEWLRYIPQKEAKEYLLSIHGLGLKSVECIRLLALEHIAFPVDVNVARIVIRLGWVPLQPLPESMQIHNLEMFPDSNKIQQYLWPRLCTLDHRTLYELHYQLITFGKVFCTKRNPNCKACPMRDECKHYASSLARTKLALPPKPTTDQSIVVTEMDHANSYRFPHFDWQSNSTSTFEPTEMDHANSYRFPYFDWKSNSTSTFEPIVEMPVSPKPENTELIDEEICYDDYINEDGEDIEDMITIDLSSQESSYMPMMLDSSAEEFDRDMNTSTALVALHPDAASIPLPKMKNVSRLKTERTVYILTDNHPLLREHTPRDPDDPSPYLLVVWLPDELESSGDSSTTNLPEEDNNKTVPGTILIPCRTAMRARFPLNGTYFQVNEVFADYTSMVQPINVPRNWLWNLEKRITYFGTGTSAITRGLSLGEVRNFFCEGFICVRAIDTKTRAPRPISSILHRNTTIKVGKGNTNVSPNKS